MPTVTDICNLALARLGDRANVTSIDPPEGSAQADACARFYPMARDTALEAHDWSFASVRVTLAELASDDPVWERAFAVPNNTIAVRGVGSSPEAIFAFDPQGPYFQKGSLVGGTPVIWTNEATPFARVTQRIVDPTRYPPIFVQALVTLLASFLAGPVVKGRAATQLAAAMGQEFQVLINRAAIIDANQSSYRQPYTPSNMARRGVNLGGQFGSSPALPFWAVPA